MDGDGEGPFVGTTDVDGSGGGCVPRLSLKHSVTRIMRRKDCLLEGLLPAIVGFVMSRRGPGGWKPGLGFDEACRCYIYIPPQCMAQMTHFER